MPLWLYRGFTAHEHLPEIGLINMNGRMYNPAVGRMLSVDNYTHEGIGLTTQAYNRYSYALNNPLKYTDPSGEEPITIALAAIATGALVGAGSYTASVALSDGGFQNWDWGSFALSTGVGAFSGGAASSIGGFVGSLAVTKGASFAIQSGLHAGLGGFTSVVGGGDFWSGVAAGGISSSISGLVGGIGSEGSLLNSGVTVAAGGVSGGLASLASGGDFWPGMRQGLIVSALNHLAHRAVQGPIYPPTDKKLKGFPNATYEGRSKGPGRRYVWRLPDGKYLEWTSKNGVVEMYNKTGKKWLGKYNPNTGKAIDLTSKITRVASFVGKGISKRSLWWTSIICVPCLEWHLQQHNLLYDESTLLR